MSDPLPQGNEPRMTRIKNFPSVLSVKSAVKNEIVRRVEGLFALADQIEARFTQARMQVDQLTPSLLARAFQQKVTTDQRAVRI